MSEMRVLLIDDEHELVSTLVERLAYRDIEAEFAVDGEQALQMLRQSAYDIVVLDLKLPGMSGSDVLKAIRAEWPDMPVLMITGHGADGARQEQIPIGNCECLAKPIGIDQLILKMKEALAKS